VDTGAGQRCHRIGRSERGRKLQFPSDKTFPAKPKLVQLSFLARCASLRPKLGAEEASKISVGLSFTFRLGYSYTVSEIRNVEVTAATHESHRSQSLATVHKCSREGEVALPILLTDEYIVHF
jgi:hypothetical protein